MFDDRTDAGNRLGQELLDYQDAAPLVLAIPKGGIEVAVQVALTLQADFAILVARKLPLPGNPEAGFGAVAEDGSVYLVEDARFALGDDVVTRIIDEQRAEIQRRIAVLRHGEPMSDLEGRAAILVDDGIAMGSTMRASIRMCRRHNAGRVVVAAPVASPRTVREMERIADNVVVLETPRFFQAVAEAYREWHDVTDAEALESVRRYEQTRRL